MGERARCGDAAGPGAWLRHDFAIATQHMPAMKFARRAPQSLPTRLRSMVWPRMGLRRLLHYRRLQLSRIASSPHAVAAGAAAGLFAAFSPLFGFHYLIAAGLALALGGSVIASAAVTSLANPLTLPMFWTASYEVGSLFIDKEHHFSPRMLLEQHSWSALRPFVEPLLLGSVLLGTAAGGIAYLVVRQAVSAYRAQQASAAA